MSKNLEQPSTSKQGQPASPKEAATGEGDEYETDPACTMCDVYCDDEEFRIRLDVSHFRPEDVTVTIRGDRLVVHAAHHDRQEKDAVKSREYIRSYILPRCVAKNKIEALYDSYADVLLVHGDKFSKSEVKDSDVNVQVTECSSQTYSEVKQELLQLPIDRQVVMTIFPNEQQKADPQPIQRLLPFVQIDEEIVAALKVPTADVPDDYSAESEQD